MLNFKIKILNKEKFCKYCGRELELGRCHCDDFVEASSKPKDNSKEIVCDTCKNTVDADSIYCPYCGMPLLIDGNNKELQKELRGDNAKDVIKIYADEMKPRDRFLFPLSFVITMSIATLFIGIIFGYLIIPEIKKAIFNYNFIRQADTNDESYNDSDPNNINNSIMEESTDINYDAETLENNFPDNAPTTKEITEPTSPTVETSIQSIETDSQLIGTVSSASPAETTKKDTLWLEKATRIDDIVSNATNNCQLLFYYPTINGEDEDEVKLLGELFKYVFYADFITQVKSYALSQEEPPVSIVFEIPKDQGGSGKIYRVKFVGHVTPRVGVAGTIKYTIIYNRSTNEIKVQNTN